MANFIYRGHGAWIRDILCKQGMIPTEAESLVKNTTISSKVLMKILNRTIDWVTQVRDQDQKNKTIYLDNNSDISIPGLKIRPSSKSLANLLYRSDPKPRDVLHSGSLRRRRAPIRYDPRARRVPKRCGELCHQGRTKTSGEG